MGLKEIQDRLQKKVKGAHISILSQSEIAASKEWIPTPSYDLNRILSGSLYKGLPNKTFTLFIGPEATGKSSFMCLCLAEAQKNGYTPIIIDTEGAWTRDFVSRWNLDPDNILYIYTPWIDKVVTILGEIIDTEEQKIAFAIDSIGGLERGKVLTDIEKDGTAKADQGILQKEIKRMLKMVVNVCKQQESIAFASGHWYGNPGQYGVAEEIGGGKYVKLAPDIIIGLKKTKLLDTNKEIIGNKVTACALKNRYYPPFQESTIEINYKDGINRLAGLMDLALKSGIAEKAGSWFTVNGEKAQGEAKAELLIDEATLNKIDVWLETTGYSTVNENIKEASLVLEEEEVVEVIEPDSKIKVTKKGKSK